MKLMGLVGGTPLPITYRVAFITNFFREPLLRRIEREHGLMRPEWTVLICLAFQDGLNPRDICEITEQPRNTVSRGVSALTGKGFVRQEPDPEDSRRVLLWLTPAGQAIYDVVMPIFVATEERVAASLTRKERETLIGLLDKVCANVETWKS